jgi:hypothetical protein
MSWPELLLVAFLTSWLITASLRILLRVSVTTLGLLYFITLSLLGGAILFWFQHGGSK